jgi:hypothetical protein
LVAGLLAASLEALGVEVEFDVPVFAFLWCLWTLVAGAGFVEVAGALVPCAISAAPEIISVIISFFMVFLLGGFRGLHTYGRVSKYNGS